MSNNNRSTLGLNRNQPAADETAEAKAEQVVIVNQSRVQMTDPYNHKSVFIPGQRTVVDGPIKKGSWLDCQIQAKLLAVVA